MRRYLAGLYGKKVLFFDGVDDYVEVPRSDSLKTPKLTVIVMFKHITITGEHMVINTDWDEEWKGSGWGISNRRILVRGADVYDPVLVRPRIYPGKVYCVGMSYDGYELYVNINNEVEMTAYGERQMEPYQDDPLQIGMNRPADPMWFNGIIYTVYVYGVSIGKEKVRRLINDAFNLRPATIRDGLVLEFIPDSLDCENGVWRDNSGNGNDGTIYGARCVYV